MDKMINIVLVEDHPLLRMGTKLSIHSTSSNCLVVAEAGSVAQSKEVFQQDISVDLVLLDIILPDGSGVDIAKYLKEYKPNIKILVLSIDTSEETLLQLLDIGINGFISKNCQPKELISAIYSVMSGLDYYGKDIAALINDVKVASMQQDDIFTKREMEIVKLCAEGYFVQQIADMLHISNRTVEAHKNNIFKKLGFNSSAELVTYAFRHGLVNTH